jgi:hypothetical protein
MIGNLTLLTVLRMDNIELAGERTCLVLSILYRIVEGSMLS